MVGMKSRHSNYYEDREFTFFIANSDNWFLTECRWEEIKEFNGYIDYQLGNSEVIAGVKSYYNEFGYNEDVFWSLNVCNMVKRGSELVN